MATVLWELMNECQTCERVCLETVAYCLGVGGSHVEGDHIQSLLDCAAFAGVCANFLARDSEAFDGLASICTDLCERCARECEAFEDSQMARCAVACRACAEDCRRREAFLAA